MVPAYPSFSSVFSQPRFNIYEQCSSLPNPKIYIIDLEIPKFTLFFGKIKKSSEKDQHVNDLDLERDILTDRLIFWVEEKDGTNRDKSHRKKMTTQISLESVMEEVEILLDILKDPFRELLGSQVTDQESNLHYDNLSNMDSFDFDTLTSHDPSNPFDPLAFISPFLFVDETEEKTKDNILTQLFDILQEKKMELYREFIAARRIQRVWREVVANPSFQVCRKRLRYEFEEMNGEL